MCGLFGAAGPNLSAKDKDAVTVLGNLTRSRGKDSTGIFTVTRPTTGKNSAFKVKTYKQLQESPVFMASKAVQNMLQENPFVIGGHCRFATHGKVNLSNAHPFNCGHFVGMHNGVIQPLYDKVNDKTDSRVLFENMQALGVVKGIKSGLDVGDMALVFINKSNGTLNYFRNDGRPLFIGIEEKKKKFFWASQKDFLEFIHKNGGVRFADIYSVSPYILHSIDMKSMRPTLTEIKGEPRSVLLPQDYWQGYPYMKEESSSTIVGPVKPGITPSLGLYTRTIVEVKDGKVEVRSAVPITARRETTVPPSPNEEEKEHTPALRYRHHDGKFLGITQAAQLVIGKDCSCDSCGAKTHSLIRPIFWLSDKSWICEECFDTKEIKETYYSGLNIVMGCIVDKNNVPKTQLAAKRDAYSMIPF